jgi:hypothetical protein
VSSLCPQGVKIHKAKADKPQALPASKDPALTESEQDEALFQKAAADAEKAEDIIKDKAIAEEEAKAKAKAKPAAKPIKRR